MFSLVVSEVMFGLDGQLILGFHIVDQACCHAPCLTHLFDAFSIPLSLLRRSVRANGPKENVLWSVLEGHKLFEVCIVAE
jgi:hypothetical protein